MTRADTWPWTVLLTATVLAAAVLRVVSLDSSLWLDEIYTLVLSARRPVAQIVTEFAGFNVHPLYSLLAHASMAVFGESAWALRLPACLFGIACIPMVYACAARVTTRVEAWAAAIILAVSYHHIWFSQNARGYTMLAFLTLFTTDVLLRPAHGRRDYVVYGLAAVAGIYTHLTMVFVVAGQAAVVLIGRAVRRAPATTQPLRPLLRMYAIIALIAAAMYAPFAPGLLATVGDETRPTVQVATAGWAVEAAIRSLFSGAGAMAIVLLVALAAAGVVSLWRRHPFGTALLIGPGVVSALAVLASGEPLRPRFFFFLSGAAAIVAGRGIGAAVNVAVTRRAGHVTAATAACALALAALSATGLPRNYRIPKQDFNGAVRYLDIEESQGRRIAAAGPICEPLRIYFGKTWSCVESMADWEAAATAESARPVLLVYTLAEYIPDASLLRNVSQCPEIRRFPGTLGGGDIVVCEVPSQQAVQ